MMDFLKVHHEQYNEDIHQSVFDPDGSYDRRTNASMVCVLQR